MAKTVKLADIAKVLNVSNVTVSKALAGKDGVSEELRIKIKELATEMGYRQGVPMHSPREGYTNNIGVLIPARFVEAHRSFYWDLYQHILSELIKKDYFGIMEIISDEDEENITLPRMIQDKKVDGIIIMGQVKSKYVQYLNTLNAVPLVFLDAYDKHINYDTVVSDNYYGMYLLTDYLIEMGHKDIMFVGNPHATSSIQDRFFGYTKALMENSVIYTPEMIIYDREIHAKDLIFDLPEKMPTAFACNCDGVARMVIAKLQDLGYRVPDDVSVVGFDNDLLSEVYDIAVTTFEVDMKVMAETSVDILIKKIYKMSYKSGRNVISGKLIIKGTVKNIS